MIATTVITTITMIISIFIGHSNSMSWSSTQNTGARNVIDGDEHGDKNDDDDSEHDNGGDYDGDGDDDNDKGE